MGKKRNWLKTALLSLLMLLVLVQGKPVKAQDGWGTYGDNITWYFHENSGLLEIKGTGAMADTSHLYAYVPWNNYKKSIVKITVSDGITEIGSDVFFGCENLTSVSLPQTVVRIGAGAFENAKKLKSIALPQKLEQLRGGAFENTGLTSVTIPATVKSIGACAFQYCADLKKVTLKAGLEKIEYEAFWGTAITEINFPSTLREISDNAFRECKGLTKVVVPESVQTFTNAVFRGCSNLRYVEFNAQTALYSNVFIDCDQLRALKLGSRVTRVDRGILGMLKNLTAVYVTSASTELAYSSGSQPNVAYTVYAPVGSKAWEHCGAIAKATFVDNATTAGQTAWQKALTAALSNTSGTVKPAETTYYTVTFNANGGSTVASKKVKSGTAVSAPANPKRAKYTFAGWYNGSQKYNFNTKVTKNITLTAKWSKVTVGKVSVSKLQNKSGKKMYVSYKKVSGAAGYQIEYATSSKFSGKKTKTTTKTAYTISGLKKGKTYYVRVRAYKVDSTGKKIYGKYSAVKKVKIKK